MEDFKNKYSSILLDKEMEAMIVVFHTYTPYDELVVILNKEFELIKKFNIKKCLINLVQMPVYAPFSKEYIQNTWFPEVMKQGMRFMAFVQPESTFGKSGMRKAHEGVDSGPGILVNYFDQYAKAYEWLKTAK